MSNCISRSSFPGMLLPIVAPPAPVVPAAVAPLVPVAVAAPIAPAGSCPSFSMGMETS